MNISSAVGQTPRFDPHSTTNVAKQSSIPGKNSVRSAAFISKQNTEQTTEHAPNQQLLNDQASSGILLDKQTIAVFEQNQQTRSNFTSSPQEGFSSIKHDQPSSKNEMAVASYQSVDNLAQRESVQKMFGVDLFA